MILVVILICLMLLVFLASDSQIQSEKNTVKGLPPLYASSPASAPHLGMPADFSDLPDDYSFSLSWNINGPGSYDSAKGILSCETEGGQRKTELTLTDEKRRAIREILSQLNVAGFPDAIKSGTCSPGELILTIRCGKTEKTVASPGNNRESGANARLASTCHAIIGIITSSVEDTALLA